MLNQNQTKPKQNKNLYQLMGTITHIGELKVSSKGTPFTNIIVDFGADGKHEFCIFRNTATTFAQAWRPGDLAVVTFTIGSREYVDKNNNTRHISTLNLISINKYNNTMSKEPPTPQQNNDNNIPF